MARWRSAALERLPELREKIAKAENVMSLWIELHLAFEKAYRDPQNDDLIARIYSYADWCLAARRNDDASHDPLTAVIVAFYEDIPTNKPAREDMPRWFSYAEVANNRHVFAYLIGDDEFDALVKHMAKNRHQFRLRQSAESKKGLGR
jgi:hypothetical protein